MNSRRKNARRISPVTAVVLATASIAAIALLVIRQASLPTTIPKGQDPVATAAASKQPQQSPLKNGGKGLSDSEKEIEYKAFVASHDADSDKKVQEQVASARYNLGFLAGKRRDFEAAKTVFKEASLRYRGTGAMDPNFGGMKDGSEYQAAVCLVAEGKKEKAKQAFKAFMNQEPLSPLAKAAYRRLVALNDGHSIPEYEKLLQHDLSQQQKKGAIDLASCGARCLDFILPLLGKQSPGFDALLKLTGTTDKGASLESMRKALKTLGLESYGVAYNRKDFANAPTPAIILRYEHFMVLKEIHPDYAVLYDPSQGPTSAPYNQRLPALNDPSFQAEMLVFKKPNLAVMGAQEPLKKGKDAEATKAKSTQAKKEAPKATVKK